MDGSTLLGIVRTRGCAPRGLDPSSRQGDQPSSCVCTMKSRHGVFALLLSFQPNKAKRMRSRDKVKWDTELAVLCLPPTAQQEWRVPQQRDTMANPDTERNYYISPSVMQMSCEICQYIYFFTHFPSFEELGSTRRELRNRISVYELYFHSTFHSSNARTDLHIEERRKKSAVEQISKGSF